MGSALRFVTLAAATPQPWRNGGGLTRELLAWPPAAVALTAAAAPLAASPTRSAPPSQANSAAWALRVSVADITQDGPFSPFAGIERCFTVLEGAGVALTLEGRGILLTPGDAPLRFDGAAAPGCRLLDGPTRDLNLMVRRNAGRAGMARAEPGMAWSSVGPWRGLYTDGPAVVDFGDGPQRLASAGLAWMGRPAEGGLSHASPLGTAPWTLVSGGPAWWLWMNSSEQST